MANKKRGGKTSGKRSGCGRKSKHSTNRKKIDAKEKIIKTPKIEKRTFEECYPEIEKLVERVRPQWTLNAVPHVSFDDIKSIIIAHIFKKWNQYDPVRPLPNWVATIVRRQFINQLRNLYLSTQRPCSRCAANLGGDQCSVYSIQCEECPLFAHWKKTKFNSHQARLPLPIENHQHEVYERHDSCYDFDGAVIKMHAVMKKTLKPYLWRIYEALYINHEKEEDVAKNLGLKSNEKGRADGYRRIFQLRKEIIGEAKKILSGENEKIDLFFV